MPRLLLVDDSPDNLELLAVLLGERYEVVSCESAEEALARLDDVKPDVVVLDIGMASIDGVQCLEAIRARPGYAGTPAVAVTAFARPVDRARFLAAGFHAVITKPVFDERALLDAVDAALGSTAPGVRSDTDGRSDAIPARFGLTAPADDGIVCERGRFDDSARGAA
jgi:CheY-like chemotaxis protein